MLRGPFRRLIRTTAGYSINTIVGPLLTLLLTPILTRLLGQADYGTIDTLMLMGNFILILSLLGLNSSLTALYYDPQRKDRQPQVVSSAFWTGLLWSAALGAVVIIGALPLTQLTLNRTDFAELTRCIGIGLPFSVMYSIQTVVLRLRFAVWRANALALLYILVSAAAMTVFVIVLRWGAAGAIYAYTTVNVVMGLASFVMAPDVIRARPSLPLVRDLVRIGLPIVPGSVAVWLLMYQDRLFLVRYLPADQALAQIGVYAIGVKLASMLSLLIAAFQSTWLPLALSIQEQPNAPRTYAKVLTYYCVGGLGLGLVMSLFAHEILLIFTGQNFVAAAEYVWLLVLVPLTSGFFTIVTVALYIEKKLGQASWTTAAAAGVNTLFNFLLIPPLGVLGAAIATAVGYLASPLLAIRVAQRARPFPYEWRKVTTTVAVYMLLVVLGLIVGSRLEPLSIALRVLLLAAYVPLLRLLGIFDTWELQLAGRALRRPRLALQWLAEREEPHAQQEDVSGLAVEDTAVRALKR